MKPSWDDAPEWANWLAMDGDGRWVWYDNKPFFDEAYDSWQQTFDEENNAEYETGIPDYDGPDWDQAFDTLERRP